MNEVPDKPPDRGKKHKAKATGPAEAGTPSDDEPLVDEETDAKARAQGGEESDTAAGELKQAPAVEEKLTAKKEKAAPAAKEPAVLEKPKALSLAHRMRFRRPKGK